MAEFKERKPVGWCKKYYPIDFEKTEKLKILLKELGIEKYHHTTDGKSKEGDCVTSLEFTIEDIWISGGKIIIFNKPKEKINPIRIDRNGKQISYQMPRIVTMNKRIIKPNEN